MPTHKGEGTRATHILTGLGRPMRQFFGVRCGRVKLVSSSLGSILGVIAELLMPTHKGEGTWATHSLTRLGRPMCQFLVLFWGFWVRCGGVKVVSKSLGSVWGISAELWVPTHKGDGTRVIRILTGLVRPLRKFLGSGAVW